MGEQMRYHRAINLIAESIGIGYHTVVEAVLTTGARARKLRTLTHKRDYKTHPFGVVRILLT